MALLSPQAIRDNQFDALLVAGFAQLTLEFAERGMDLSLIRVQVEDMAHLLFGFTTRSGVGHRQASGDAVGRKEQVSRSGFKPAVEVQRKSRIALCQRLALRCSSCGGRAEDE